MAYQKSIFFMPVRFNNFNRFVKLISRDNRWTDTPSKNIVPRYLLPYAVRIAKNPELFRAFDLKKEDIPNIYTFEREINLKKTIQIESVRLCCFSTGIGFIEFHINFEGLSVEQITNFAYTFKKATRMNGMALPDKKVSLYNGAKSLLPFDSDVEIFFTASAPFKYECLTFHYLQLNADYNDEIVAQRRLSLLKRSYNTSFDVGSESDFDMIYKPYANDHWGGSTEGLVNISYDNNPQNENYYFHTLKENHLEIDYYFMYLLLLNQRFSAIQYISDIAECSDTDKKKTETTNKKIIRLKTIFSFKIISDDQIFQNVYSKMYNVLDIDCLLEDIRDNENQLELIQNLSSAKAEKRSSQFLMGISLLSLFSALIDASSYFDRISFLRPIATILGTVSTVFVIIFCIAWMYKKRNDR